MSTPQDSYWRPLFVVLVVFGLILAIPLAFLLLAVACFALRPRPVPGAPEAVSPVVATPDGAFTAQIWRHEEPGGGGWGEAPIRFKWLLSVTGPTGTHECGVGMVGGGQLSEYDVEGNRKVRGGVSWTVPGRILSVASGQGSTTVYVLDTCIVSMYAPPTPVTATSLELTPTLRSKLERLHLPAAEIDGLGYVQLRGQASGAQIDFFCERDDVLLVVGPGFKTPGHIVSKGPVLLIGEAECGGVASDKWVFIDDEAWPRGRVVGTQVYAADSIDSWHVRFETGVTRVPSDQPVPPAPATLPMDSRQVREPLRTRWPTYPVVAEPAPTAATLTPRITDLVAITAQPAELAPELRDRLKPLSLPEDQLTSLKYVRLADQVSRSRVPYFVCESENTLVVLDADLRSYASVFSRGPILCTDRAEGLTLRSLKWIFIDGEVHSHANAPVIYVNRRIDSAGTLARDPVLVPPDPELDDYLQLRSRPGKALGTRSSAPQ